MDFITLAPPLLKAFWYIAIFTTVLFTALMFMTFAGGGDVDHSDVSDMDTGTEHGGHDFQILSFRNLINFLLGFSWAGIGLYPYVESKLILIILSLSVGSGMVYLFFLMLRGMMVLSRDQTMTPEDTIGKTGQVYLTIPAQRAGKGKVMVSVGGSTREYDAITDGNNLANGSPVKVTEVLPDHTLVVLPA
ncbi:MAG: NfeD family protein [Lewinellaceae bacterium]|nr:NfeD family protein [Saprospiraceae bacterium]MCB9339740.1 NfeD family protein [Lewinellaceae bacterium]